ncbi:endonuclease domain-containing protein [uncultured Friedmanniella sp.]|uniref:endonuclease domain-containing protein n=1 Tax=uncultured Friedmanniella sp. TaxID=335381 RepID=UPI0035CA8131
MWQAFELTPERPGNQLRRELLVDSRDEPWSAAERRGHRLLRAAGIDGWESNHPVVIDGHLYRLDIGFPKLRLVIEIDGRLHEDDPEIFENDRRRQNAVVLDGWTVLRFTWRMLEDEPDACVAAVLRAIDMLQ